MSGAGGLLLLLGAAGIVGLSWWIYYRREFPVSKRAVLAALRAAAAILILLLLLDPSVPLSPDRGEGGLWVLLDASASMAAPGDGGSAWDRARGSFGSERGAAGALEGAGTVILFGSEVGRIAVDSLPPESPGHGESRLAPAVRLAVELGAPGIRIVTDGRIEDRDRVEEALAGSGLPSQWVDVGEEVVHAGILDAVAPGRLAARDTAELDVTIFGEGLDSVSIVAAVEGGDSARTLAAVPSVGRGAIARISLPLPADSGRIRVRVRLDRAGPGSAPNTGGMLGAAEGYSDPFPSDDTLTVEIDVGRPRGGVVLVTTRPGWESRSLLPVVSRSAGLGGRGFLQLSGGRFLTLETDGAAPRVVPRGTVEAAMAAAEILILEGLDADGPEWLVAAANRRVPSIHLVADREEASLAGVTVGEPLAGEWYPREEALTSPLLGSLSGADWEGIPPLERPLPLLPPSPDAQSPPPVPVLEAVRSRGGAPAPVLVLGGGGEGRWAVALARGFWRWDAREGAARRNYARLWSGVTGWLLAGESEEAARAAGPPAGARAADTGDPPPGSGDIADLPEPIPSPTSRAEMSHPRVDPAALLATGENGPGASGPGRPLREFPLPYLLVIALLCVEWLLRRREGLR